jgi:hypothetical protein
MVGTSILGSWNSHGPNPSIDQGNNFNKRLGHGDGPNLAAPKRVDALAGEHVIMSVAWWS